MSSTDWDKIYPQKSVKELQDLLENLSSEFIEEVQEKQAEKAKKAAAKAGNDAPVQEPAMATARQQAPKNQAAEDEFFGNIPERDGLTSDDLDWGEG
jgi:hypothetical protein